MTKRVEKILKTIFQDLPRSQQEPDTPGIFLNAFQKALRARNAEHLKTLDKEAVRESFAKGLRVTENPYLDESQLPAILFLNIEDAAAAARASGLQTTRGFMCPGHNRINVRDYSATENEIGIYFICMSEEDILPELNQAIQKIAATLPEASPEDALFEDLEKMYQDLFNANPIGGQKPPENNGLK